MAFYLQKDVNKNMQNIKNNYHTSFVLGFILIIMAGAYWWKRNKNRKRLSASKYFSNVGTSDLKDEEFN